MMVPASMKTGIIILLVGLLTGFLSINTYAEKNYLFSCHDYSGTENFLSTEEDEAFEEEPDVRIASPAKAAMLSVTLPGLGQIYNRKYWKVPIIYAGYGAVFYFLEMNYKNYQMFRRNYIYSVDGNPNTQVEEDFKHYSTDVLRRAMNYYRRNLEITYIVAAALYILNILDASVDAHLMDFDVSEEISMRMSPAIERVNNISQYGTGLKLTIRF